MSTRAYIAAKNPTLNKMQVAYVHYDGYPEGVGSILVNEYNDKNLSTSLVNICLDPSVYFPSLVPLKKIKSSDIIYIQTRNRIQGYISKINYESYVSKSNKILSKRDHSGILSISNNEWHLFREDYMNFVSYDYFSKDSEEPPIQFEYKELDSFVKDLEKHSDIEYLYIYHYGNWKCIYINNDWKSIDIYKGSKLIDLKPFEHGISRNTSHKILLEIAKDIKNPPKEKLFKLNIKK